MSISISGGMMERAAGATGTKTRTLSDEACWSDFTRCFSSAMSDIFYGGVLSLDQAIYAHRLYGTLSLPSSKLQLV